MNSNQTKQKTEFVGYLTQIVLDNLTNEQFGVSELAKQAGMSRSHLHRKLNLEGKQSVSQFIRKLRLEEAVKLLEKSNLSASEVAYRVGFNSPSYFNKSFHDMYGIPPGELKNKEKRNQVSNHKPIEKEAKSHFVLKKRYTIVAASVLIGLVASIVAVLQKTNNTTSLAEKSIAILPFDNLTTEKNNQHFADGLANDLLSRLGKIEGLKVTSWTSSEMFREKGEWTMPQIAGLLGVSHILTGSVQKSGNKVRINVRLVDAKNDKQVWGEPYDMNLGDVFEIQSKIAEQVTDELSLVLTDEQKNAIRQDETISPKAMEYMQMGMFHYNKRTNESFEMAKNYFELAITEDPNYALAYAFLAQALFSCGCGVNKDSALHFANKALEIDKNLAEPYCTFGDIYMNEWKWKEAEAVILKAVKTNPKSTIALRKYSYFLEITGDLEGARKVMDQALVLDPVSHVARFSSQWLYYVAGNFEMVIKENKFTQEICKECITPSYSVFCSHVELGNDKEALECFKKINTIKKYTSANIDSIYIKEGMTGILSLLTKKANFGRFRAKIYAMLCDMESTLESLEEAYGQHNEHSIGNLINFYLYKDIHNHPRFIAIIEKMGLMPYYEKNSIYKDEK